MKKLFIIIAIILLIFAIGLGVFLAWKKSREMMEPLVGFPTAPGGTAFPEGAPGAVSGPAGQAPAGQEIIPLKLRAISDQSVFDYWIANLADSTDIFYLTESGQVFKVREAAEDEEISSQVFWNLQSAQASRDGKRVIVKYGDPISPKLQIFEPETEVWQPLSENVMAAVFSPDSQKIAYLEKSGGNSTISNLVIKDLIGAKPKTTKIISLNQKDFNLKWLTDEKILLIPRPSSQYESEIWEVDIKKKTIALFTSGKGLIVDWADDATWGLKFSVEQLRNPRLQLIDKEGSLKANFEFTTLPNKCLATLSIIYCAVPQDYTLTKQPDLPDDFLKGAAYSRDFIYLVDLTQNKIEALYAQDEPAIDAVRFSLLNEKLFFINRYDNKLYVLE